MNLLIDANISYRIVKLLSTDFQKVIHVSQTELSVPAKDSDVWDWAKKNNFTIITQDEDFVRLLVVHGFPPKLILLRMGNQRTQFLSEIVIKHKEEIERLLSMKEYSMLEIY